MNILRRIKSRHKYEINRIYNIKVKDLRSNKSDKSKRYKVISCDASTSAYLGNCYQLTLKEIKNG